jgi:hypothetical protein
MITETQSSKGSVVIMFLMIYYRLCFSTPVNSVTVSTCFCTPVSSQFTTNKKLIPTRLLPMWWQGLTTENKIDQILEVLTSDQGYMMFFNNVQGLNCLIPDLCRCHHIHFFSTTYSFLLNFRPCSSSYCHSSKDT